MVTKSVTCLLFQYLASKVQVPPIPLPQKMNSPLARMDQAKNFRNGDFNLNTATVSNKIKAMRIKP